ncbi:ABC1 family-domain-containing protein [Suillus clintonianus]|uniref:ABC1 family-domain-containing protein n=1 Tax=Suillus clintonianus TaxID=1904413 RepID=UPI001B877C9D|nr:ABC1 family-domain-containing protein [Suillus clintonianus]KAG2150579.1 ABC1 family-domain-containing protein [Suillus clintonianus]
MHIMLKFRGPPSWHGSRSFLRSQKSSIRYDVNLNKRLASFDAPQALPKRPRGKSWFWYPATFLALTGAGYYAYENHQPTRHAVLATLRCSQLAQAAISGAIDYKRTFARTYASEDDRLEAVSQCHVRSATKVLNALLANGGIYIKLGQHIASLIVLPREWTSTMAPLQDKCDATPYEGIAALFLSDMGQPINELFDDFDPVPIGVASLAQVHVGFHKASGKKVAVKVQHPHLVEFFNIDINMVQSTLGWIKYWFPEFEFTWLGEEMRENLPREMDFVHEARNTAHAVADFENIKTSLYIPEVISANKRVLVMEYIQGGRVDDLAYLAKHNIDRNKVALELTRIFNRMVFMNGWFHADPHPGNLLIRPASKSSKSPYNFEIALLDHGLYFDLERELRVNYSRLWLSLIARSSPTVDADRRKYAELVGNITSDLYPVFEAAITGRLAPDGIIEADDEPKSDIRRATGMLDMASQTEEEMELIRNTVAQGDILVSVLDVLRRLPRRVLMVMKLNDLARHLDHSLATTHSSVRIFLITSKYCMKAVWQDEKCRFREGGVGFGSLLGSAWAFATAYSKITFIELMMDWQASLVKSSAWLRGFYLKGLAGAHDAAAGLY